MPGIIAELKRRNVIRVAGLYLVGSWLLLQVADTLLPIFGAPGWMSRTLVLLLALGMLPALAFAWVFELTPDGLKRDARVAPGNPLAAHTAQRMNRLIVALLALAVLYFCVDKFVLAPRREAALVVTTTQTVQARADTRAAEAALDNSIAVLPFVNMSGEADNQFFSDGISEELLNVLVGVKDLRVASRTSSFAYRDKKMASPEIARELKVGHILEGSVRKSGNRVRITAQLIDATSDRHLWSETYDRELDDIFAIQDEIANAIVDALRGSLDANRDAPVVRVQADTENMQAYEKYLKARELFIGRVDLPQSLRLFEEVVAMDPQFARGWEGLAAVAAVIRSWGYTDRDFEALSERAARRALELDPTLSTPWAALAQVQKHAWPIEWTGVLDKLGKAVAADPRNATALLWRGIAWIELGFFDRAIAEFDRCLALEPGYHNCRAHKSFALLLRGDEDAALALLEQGIGNDFFVSRSEHFVPVLVKRGEHRAALLLMASIGVPPQLRSRLLQRLSDGRGAPDPEVTAVVRKALSVKDDPMLAQMGASPLLLWNGDFDAVGRTDDSMNAGIYSWDRYPAAYRNSPGMKLKLTRMGAPVYWRAHGFPPQCRAVGREDFTCD